MRLTLISPQPAFDPQGMATGLQWRMDQLTRGLSEIGVSVNPVHLDSGSTRPGDLEPYLENADAVLCGYWQLLERLPRDTGIPVIADCVAPRPLEVQFSDPDAADTFTSRYRQALARADLLLAGNRRQRWLLAAWLADAGVDLRREIPVAVVPLAAEPGPKPRTGFEPPLVLVTGGREWPWRQSGRWLETLAAGLPAEHAELHVFGNQAPAGSHGHAFQPWADWQSFLDRSAHVGLELAERNPEREVSQSYRITACLQAGLPVIVNDYLELAETIREHDAGWTVAEPAQAVEVMQVLLDHPAEWTKRARGAWKLARTELSLATTIEPLAAWLEAPRRRPRRRRPASRAAAIRTPGPSVTSYLTRLLLSPFRRNLDGNGVMVVTRSDLFPADHGAAVKILETARALAGCGRRVGLVTGDRSCWWEVVDGRFVRRRLPLWLRLAALPRHAAYLLHRLRGGPADNAFLYWPLSDPGYGLRAVNAGRTINAGIYLAEFPGYCRAARMARYLNGGSAVLAEHNVEYARLQEQSAALTDRQYRWLRRIELHQAACMDAVVCVSRNDRGTLIGDGIDPTIISVIPHGVSNADYVTDPADPAEFGLDPDLPALVYHGTYSYPPNRQAIDILIHEILPRLEARGHPCQILAIGSKPPCIPDQPHLHTPGSLESIAGALKACDLAVVPLISGGGTRMKILDYFAAGLPVIATSKGCEGLLVEDGNQLLVRDDWDAMADAVVELLDDPDAAKQLATAARAHAESLDWSEIGKRYDTLFRNLDVNRKS